jgi:hypothetical protein
MGVNDGPNWLQFTVTLPVIAVSNTITSARARDKVDIIMAATSSSVLFMRDLLTFQQMVLFDEGWVITHPMRTAPTTLVIS